MRGSWHSPARPAYPSIDLVLSECARSVLEGECQNAEKLASGYVQSCLMPKRPIRPVTKLLFEAMTLDIWPNSSAAIVDFGLESQSHYEALHAPIRAGQITLEQLDAALGSGSKLTALVRSTPANTHKEIVFRCLED